MQVTYSLKDLLSFYNPLLPLPEGIHVLQQQKPEIFEKESQTPLLLQKHRTKKYKDKNDKINKIKREIDQGNENTQEPFQLNATIPFAAETWYYLDPKNNVHGPYGNQKLRSWLPKFPEHFSISTSDNLNSFKDISEVFPIRELAFTYNPILYPFMGVNPQQSDDAIESIYLDFCQSLNQPAQ